MTPAKLDMNLLRKHDTLPFKRVKKKKAIFNQL